MGKAMEILVLAAVTVSVSSCDMFRTMVGRPTSADIAAKKAKIEQFEALRQQPAPADSLASADTLGEAGQPVAVQVGESSEDSLAAAAALKESGAKVAESRLLTTEAKGSLTHRYYIIVGAFSSRDNASKLVSKISAKGYEACVIAYRSGLTAVGVCPSNSLTEACAALGVLRGESFCPADAWILDNN